MSQKKTHLRGILQSLGLVFGDIGTSPIYTLTVIFLITERTPENVIGVLSLIVWTLILLVTVTFYMRTRIGMKAFRAIHVLSLVSYLSVAVHGLLAGTDSSMPTVAMLYAGTLLTTVFLFFYWLIAMLQKKLVNRQTAPINRS